MHEYSPNAEIVQDLEIISVELTTFCNKKVLFTSVYWPDPNDNPEEWLDKFNVFLNSVAESYSYMLIAGDFNLPKISLESPENTSGPKEVSFLEILIDHYLTQMNYIPTRGDRVLDLVITNVPDQVCVRDVLSRKDSGIMTDHGAVCFEFRASTKSRHKMNRTVYYYRRGDFDGLRCITVKGLNPGESMLWSEMIASAPVVETSVKTNNSPSQDYTTNPDDHSNHNRSSVCP